MAKRRHDIQIPKSHGEMARMLRAVAAERNELFKLAEHQRRINWMIVNQNHGRIEIPADVYTACMQGPPEDYVIKMDVSKDKKTIVFEECDEKGEAVSKIIVPPQFKLGA
jgi:hypothetical protein